MADPAAPPLVAASRGSHVVLGRSFLPAAAALLIPNTPDGRVLFVIPWHGHTLVGTTDVAVPYPPAEPQAPAEDIDFILDTAGRYLSPKPRREDVLGTFAGIRPLVTGAGNTAALARDHTIRVDEPGLVTITGGKWTTYREMAEECVDQAAELAGLPRRPCPTQELRVHGYHPDAVAFGDLAVYGSDAPAIQELMTADPGLGEPLHPALPYRGAEVVWAVRAEMARTVADVLARRTRALPLNGAAALAMAPLVTALMARELGRGADWEAEQVRAFGELARGSLAG
jgi:glycerol-3-phosphate dehydrogenase